MKNKKNKNKELKPNIFAWFIYTTFAKLFCFFKHIKIDRKVFKEQLKISKQKNKGFIILYNHHSNKDHFVLTNALNYKRSNYVIAKYFSYIKPIRIVTNLVKTISKDQFKPDLSSIRQMKRAIDRPGIVAIAPEGQVSIHGEGQFISRGIVKLIRFCKTDVITLQTYGIHFAYPKWRKSKRKTKINAKFLKVISEEEIANLSDDEIFDRVVKGTHVNSFAIQKEVMHKIKGKTKAAGLDSSLIICPKCHSKYTHVTDKNTMYCTHCNNSVLYNDYGFFEKNSPDSVIFENEREWYNFQKQLIKEEFLNNDDFHLDTKVTLYRNYIKETVLDEFATGVVHINKERIWFEGIHNGENYTHEFLYNSLFQLPYSPRRHFFIPDDEGGFKFVPTENPNEVIEWVMLVDVIREIKEENGKIF